jgi:ABC-type bacteriocin/lantibiotic exporter with double-glycine peptidase domain
MALFPSRGEVRSQQAQLESAIVKSSTRWVLYSLFRVGLFAAALVAMLLLGLELWVAAIVATIVAFCISYIFFSEPRDALARDLEERRMRAATDADSDAENSALDRAEATGFGGLEDDRSRQA